MELRSENAVQRPCQAGWATGRCGRPDTLLGAAVTGRAERRAAIGHRRQRPTTRRPKVVWRASRSSVMPADGGVGGGRGRGVVWSTMAPVTGRQTPQWLTDGLEGTMWDFWKIFQIIDIDIRIRKLQKITFELSEALVMSYLTYLKPFIVSLYIAYLVVVFLDLEGMAVFWLPSILSCPDQPPTPANCNHGNL